MNMNSGFYHRNDRNSCSKIDHDATMCATKIDFYCNTGLSRPCYNVQIGVSDGIIVNASLFQRPGDAKTFIPFMERYKEFTGELPLYPMAVQHMEVMTTICIACQME